MILSHYWWIVIPGILLGLYAQMKLMSTYGKYSRIGTASGLTGAQAAREILDRAGLQNVPVEEVGGHLSDHYDPLKRALFVSSENYHGTSLAAVGVAAHEAGHALQHRDAYALLNFRMMMVPALRIASGAWAVMAVLGFILGGPFFAKFVGVAIGIFTVMALFNLVTLPVEYNASSRAKEQLLRLGIVREDERKGVDKVLGAAALTYVAALVTSLLQLAQFLLLARDQERS
jgi:hypothetical protein